MGSLLKEVKLQKKPGFPTTKNLNSVGYRPCYIEVYPNYNLFWPNFTFLYSLKTSEKLWFSDVFRGYRNGTVGQNGLNTIQISFQYWDIFHSSEASFLFAETSLPSKINISSDLNFYDVSINLRELWADLCFHCFFSCH